MIYDYIIIGGGIAGLYAGFKLSKTQKILILEKNDYLGGRVEEIKFNNETIKLGAGIAAKNNKHLLKLLNILKIKYNIFQGNISVISDSDYYTKKYHNNLIRNIKEKVKYLQEHNINYKNLNFKEFMYKYFPKKDVDNFFLHCEYNDFLESDIDYHIKYYPITDNSFSNYDIIYLNWNDLVNKLIKNIKLNKSNIKKDYEVININRNNNLFIINNEFYSKKIIFALTLKPLVKLTHNLINIDYSKYINSIPFVRIYTYHKNGHNYNNNKYTILANNNPLQKIIIISEKILMASYSDNNNAIYWKKYINDKNKLKQKVFTYLKQISNSITNIDDIYIKYWDEGVHYFYPINSNLKDFIYKLSNPSDNIKVIGEIVSLRQGWVEGAIESVDRVI